MKQTFVQTMEVRARLVYKDFLLFFLILASSWLESYLIPFVCNKFWAPSVYIYYVLPSFVAVASFFAIIKILIGRERKEKLSVAYLCRRFRFKSPSFKEILIAIGLLIFTLVSIGFSQYILGLLGLSNSIALNNFREGIVPTDINDKVVVLMIVGIILGTILEEVFWRGYLLPLQEVKIGKYAWILNGLLWAFSHILTYNPSKIIIAALGFSFIASKFKNTTITMIAHLLMNSLVLLRLVYYYT